MEFKDLAFEDRYLSGIQAKVTFPNGYGASVIKGPYSYGGRDNLYELAVLKLFDDGKYHICYDTPITDDVIGHLTEDDVTRYLQKIEQLEEK